MLSGHELFVFPFLPHWNVNFNVSDSKSGFSSSSFHETLKSFICSIHNSKMLTTGLLVRRLIETPTRSYWSVELDRLHADVCRLTLGCAVFFLFLVLKSFSRMKPWSFPPSHRETFSAIGFRCCRHKRLCCSNNEWKREIN